MDAIIEQVIPLCQYNYETVNISLMMFLIKSMGKLPSLSSEVMPAAWQKKYAIMKK